MIPDNHWEVIAAGVAQRIRAINRFLLDLYNDGQDVVPEDVMFTSQHFFPEVLGFRPAKDVFVHIYGIDLVHLGDGRDLVLEDNLRIPSGISYQLKALGLVSQHIPEIASGYDIVPFAIGQTFHNLFRSLCDTDSPVSVILTDGKFGSASSSTAICRYCWVFRWSRAATSTWATTRGSTPAPSTETSRLT